MVKNGDLIHKEDSLNTEDHLLLLSVRIGEHQEDQQNVVEEVTILHRCTSFY